MSTELVVIEKHEVQAVFTDMSLIDPILQKIADDARSIVADVATAKGRKEIASVAYRVAQSKTYLDGLGKELVADMKELPKKVDASRKHMRDFLDALKDEAEAAARKDKEAAEQRERDAKLAQERAEQAKKKAEQDLIEANRRAELAAEKAEADKKAAEQAAARREEDAAHKERERIAADAKIEADKVAARNANTEHKRSINLQAIAGLVATGISEEQAKAVLVAIVKGAVPNVSINY